VVNQGGVLARDGLFDTAELDLSVPLELFRD
jgi:hypothetical protein